MIQENIELKGCAEVEKDVQNRIKTVGVRGLDVKRAQELGLFKRISNLLCASHAAVMAAYRIYGGASSILNDFGGRRNDIARAMNEYERSFMKFVSFWTDYYASGDAGKEVNEETENLYHRIMMWAQLPESWQLGESQHTEEPCDVAIKVDADNGKVLYFHKSEVNTQVVGDAEESWCVTKYDTREHRQTTVNTDMDKASAMMVAKRMSDEDKQNVYTASQVVTVMEKKTTVTPFKAYQANETIGKTKNVKL